MKLTLSTQIVAATLACLLASSASADIVRIDAVAFEAGSGLITFSEYAGGTTNPVYAPGIYGGSASSPTVTFGGYFAGQGLSTTPDVDCPGSASTGCIVGNPFGSLSLDAAAPATVIVGDSSNPTSPVLSGSPTFNGSIAILFSNDQAGVGLEGGYFDAPGSTSITAFARDGSLLGSVTNNGTGIEFLGLVTADGEAQIAGLLFSLVGDEPAGFAIDNLRFGVAGQVTSPVPEPATWGMLGLGLAMIGMARRRKA
jgi:hypothetical protein